MLAIIVNPDYPKSPEPYTLVNQRKESLLGLTVDIISPSATHD